MHMGADLMCSYGEAFCLTTTDFLYIWNVILDDMKFRVLFLNFKLRDDMESQ